MPRIIETTVYKYDELSEKAKERARDWYREANAGDSNFADHLTDKGGEFETIAKFCGWSIRNGMHDSRLEILWSGFSSQGDGLHFRGDWKAADVDTAGLKAHAPLDTALHTIADTFAKLAAEYPAGVGAIVGNDHRYSHEYTVTPELYPDEDMEDDAVPKEALDSFRAETRALMKWMYRELEASYIADNEDGYVAETIIANEYEFLESGKKACK